MEHVTNEKDQELIANLLLHPEQNLTKRPTQKSNDNEKNSSTSISDDGSKKKDGIISRLIQSLNRFFKHNFQPKVVKSGLITGVAINALGFVGYMFSKNNDVNDMMKEMVKTNPVGLFIISGIAGPLIEELLYRRVVFSVTKKYSKSLAYVVSSFLFAFEHFGFNFNTLIEKFQSSFIDFPILFSVGCILAYDYESTGYLSSNIIAHSFNNFIVSVLMYFDLI